MIYNASAYKSVEDTKIRDFLHFIFTNNPDKNDFSQTLSDTVERLKEDERFRSYYAAMNLHDRDIRKMALEEGARQQAIKNAVVAVKEFKVTPQVAAEKMNAPLEEVLEALKAN